MTEPSESARPLTFDHLRSKKKAVTRRLPVCMDSEIADRYEAAKAARDEAESNVRQTRILRGVEPTPDMERALEDAQAALDQVEAEAEEATVTFVFRSLGGKAFDELLTEHAPTEAQREANRKNGLPAPAFNQETFTVALLARSVIDPKLSEDEWKVMRGEDEWNAAEWADIFNAAWAVNQTSRVIDMGKGSGGTRS